MGYCYLEWVNHIKDYSIRYPILEGYELKTSNKALFVFLPNECCFWLFYAHFTSYIVMCADHKCYRCNKFKGNNSE